jgi:RNA recognition motif-containing protein
MSSLGGDDGCGELDAAAQNLRLRSKRDATPNTCVYVGFLGWWVTEKELEACFAPHGALVSVRVSGVGLLALGGRVGFWLAAFMPASSSDRLCFCSHCSSTRPFSPPFSHHARNRNLRRPQLLISKKSRRSREQAFVEFASIASAQAAILAMDGVDAATLVKQPGCGGLVVRFADRKKEEEM